MSEKGPECRRKLVYIPIVHALADMGTLGPSVQRAKIAAFGRDGAARANAKVERMWDGIERAAGKLVITPGTVRVYQDGLPVCGREQEIVSELAAAGSRNHRLLLKLQARGATLMGTESPELLIEEHRLASAALQTARTLPAGTDPNRAGPDLTGDTLIERRDRYIAGRIDETLAPGETGILFIGMLHQVAKYLPGDIAVHSFH